MERLSQADLKHDEAFYEYHYKGAGDIYEAKDPAVVKIESNKLHKAVYELIYIDEINDLLSSEHNYLQTYEWKFDFGAIKRNVDSLKNLATENDEEQECLAYLTNTFNKLVNQHKDDKNADYAIVSKEI